MQTVQVIPDYCAGPRRYILDACQSLKKPLDDGELTGEYRA